MTHHTTSTGKRIAIAEMNDYHLHNALKKMRAPAKTGGSHEFPDDAARKAHLALLEAEQARRGGPPKDAK